MNDKDLEYVLDGDAVLTHRLVDEYRRLLTELKECVIANQRKHERLAELENDVIPKLRAELDALKEQEPVGVFADVINTFRVNRRDGSR